MLCPRINVQGGLASMRQKTSKSKFPHRHIAVGAASLQLVSKKRTARAVLFIRLS
jgi:hypothetical protein